MSLFLRTNYETTSGHTVCCTHQHDGSVTIAVGNEERMPMLVTIAPKLLSNEAVGRLVQAIVSELGGAS